MIQRIQSLFLFLAIVTMTLTYAFPLAYFYGANANLGLHACRLDFFDPTPGIVFSPYFILPIMALGAIIIILLITSLFSFKNRKRQLRLNRISIFLVLVFLAGFFFGYVHYLEEATKAIADYQIGSIMPLITFILIMLANRGISKDEKLIRSMDRLR